MLHLLLLVSRGGKELALPQFFITPRFVGLLLSFSTLPIRLVIVIGLLLSANGIVFGKGSFTIKPSPKWVRTVVPAEDPKTAAVPPGSSSSQLLDDEQTKVGNGTVERYYHMVRRVDSTSGLDDLSQLRFYFEPSYQQLAIHFVRIQRGAQIIDALRPGEIKTIQQEDELDQQLYNGSLATLIFVNDLRVGDVVDYAYSITGENPVLGGRFTDTLYLADSSPIQELFLRVLYPTDRKLEIKNNHIELSPSSQTLGSDTEYIWYRKHVPGIDTDDYIPVWFQPYPSVTLSEFPDWASVVGWALPFYRDSPLKNSELRAKIAQWKQANSLSEGAIGALRFVQDEIRYLGIELGRYSHQPTEPDQVFARRFGDCKDKSRLLTSILNEMGIEAAPALINSHSRSSIDSWQPTPYAFDHVIVRAVINGKTYWFDPTMSYQRGGLDEYYDPPYERALVVRAGEQGLSKIPTPNAASGSISVVEQYDAQPSGATTMSVTTTYRGSEANAMRYEVSISSLAELGKEYLNFYADNSPSINADGPIEVKDDQKTNVVIVKEKYVIRDLWKNNFHRFIADRIYQELDKPGVSQRTMPLKVRYPLSIQQTIIINLGGGFTIPELEDEFSDDSMKFEYRFTKNGDQLRLHYSLKTFADSVSVANVAKHLNVLDQAQNVAVYDLQQRRYGRSAQSQSFNQPPSVLLWLVIILGIPASVVLVLWLIRRRSASRLTEFSRKLKAEPGITPETAIRVSDGNQVESMLQNYSCRCGARPYNPDTPPSKEHFSYDGQRLLGVRFSCPSCRQDSDLYLNVPAIESVSG